MAKPSFSSAIGGVILLTTVYLFGHTFDQVYQTSILTAGRGPVFYPRIVLGAMGVFSLIVVFEGLSTHSEAMSTQAYLVLSAGVALTGAYIFTINWAGFVIPTLIFTSLMPITLGYKKWKTMLILSVIYILGVWYIFEKVFLIILPSSPWFEVF
jgi:putative tricarboxylic transport membrane protein